MEKPYQSTLRPRGRKTNGKVLKIMMGGNELKETACAAVGLGMGVLSWLVGGFDMPILSLLICMGADYLTGLLVAGVFHASPKTRGGGLSSQVGWKGLVRKKCLRR